jgi:DNA adenine methylase
MHSPLNYLGGKSRLAERIVSQIQPHVCCCEPFCGAAWVLFAKDPSKVEVINDSDGELVNMWRVLQNHLEEFLRYYKFAVVSRQVFEWEQKKNPSTLTDVQRAVRYYYLQKMAFGGKTTGRTFGTSAMGAPRLNLTTMEDVLLEVHWRLARVVIENLDACECIRRYDRPSTFFYLDPPYWGTVGYVTPFKAADYERLRCILAAVSGRFLLSLNDTREVRKVFRGFRIRTVQTGYSLSNPRAGGRRVESIRELLIDNFK